MNRNRRYGAIGARVLGFFLPILIAGAVGAGAAADTATESISPASSTVGPGAPAEIRLLAGGLGGAGYVDATGGAARFNLPWGGAVDGAGNLYIADSANDVIRRVNRRGEVTTLAGAPGQPGSADGSGSDARFSGPRGIAVDQAGNVYVADTGNDTIRKLASDGTVTTLAGMAGQPGSTDGSGSAARFNGPAAVAVDGSGDLYVTDGNNFTVRKITPDGKVTTLAGEAGYIGSEDGYRHLARFDHPAGVAVDGLGFIYVCDAGNNTIRKISPKGLVNTLAGLAGQTGSEDGVRSNARFYNPIGLAISGGTLYVADASNDTIRKVTRQGVVTTLAGAPGQTGSADGIGSSARFWGPAGIAADRAGNVYVSDTNNETIRSITPDGAVTTLAGMVAHYGSVDGIGSAARFSSPVSISLDRDGNLYVTDEFNETIRRITPDGVVTTIAGSPGQIGSADGIGSAARFFDPQGVVVDREGNVYVSDTNNETVRRITPDGVVTTIAGSPGQTGSTDGSGSCARFFSPAGLAIDAAGNIYIADSTNNTIRKVSPDGMVSTIAGSPGQSGSADGIGSAARFNNPYGIAVDDAGNLYVADRANDTIRKVSPDGQATTLAGTAGQYGSTDGTGSAARFTYPTALAVDGAGNIFVTDWLNDTIRKVTPDGTVTTVAGAAGFLGVRLGLNGTLSQPQGLGLDRFGNAYVTGESSIEKVIFPRTQ